MVPNQQYIAYKTILFLLITSLRSSVTWAQNNNNTDNNNGLDRNLDRFNYDQTRTTDTYQDFGPEDWGDLLCPDLETCTGWVDKWEYGKNWELGGSCQWCPAEGDNDCGNHHQSPINVERIVALEYGGEYKECIDSHWMKYIDSACSYDQLIDKNAIFVDRHALRIVQPIIPDSSQQNETHRLACRSQTASWGRIDFSKGFSQWWYLSHVDFHVPSEHYQEGRRYDGEMQLYHFYSVTGEEAGVNNEMAAVTIFLEAYDDGTDYDFLNKLICAWRDDEEKTRAECGLDSILTEYPGCMTYNRGHTDDGGISTQGVNRGLNGRNDDPPQPRRQAMSAHDLIIKNHMNMAIDDTYIPQTIQLDKDQHNVDDSAIDWDAFIAEQYERDNENHHGRELLNYDHVGPWHNYFGMLGVRTEYYYRYSGTQTIPPCHGKFIVGNNRENTNHWRVMKDPLRISKRQLNEMHRLLRQRIAPLGDPTASCKPDTAAKVNETSGLVDVARPLQSKTKLHYVTFCECDDWKSKWIEDQNWCAIADKRERFYQRPYNFVTDKF